MKHNNELDWLFDHHQIPEHTRETLVNYLTKGWEPGGFVTAMLAMDMERAVYAADFVNGKTFSRLLDGLLNTVHVNLGAVTNK